MNIISLKEARERNLKHYYTGNPCKRNHYSLRFTSTRQCHDCLTEFTSNKRKENPRLSADYAREAYRRNPEHFIKNKRNIYFKDIEKSREEAREYYYKKGKYTRRVWLKKPTTKTIYFMRSSINRVLKGSKKKSKTETILGFTRQDLVTHLEKQFTANMSWSNHGEWHIDHITPIQEYISKGITDPSIINCLSNLRPIWSKDNLQKSNKIEFLL